MEQGSDLAAAVRELAELDRRSPEVLVRTPAGKYRVHARGYGGNIGDLFVISRSQLQDLMAAGSLSGQRLADPATLRRLVNVVMEFHRRRTGEDLQPT